MQDLHYFDPYPLPWTAEAPHIKSSLILKEGCPVLEVLASCVFPAAWQKNKAICLFLQNPCLRISVRPRCTGKPIFRQQPVASSHTNSPLCPQPWPKPDLVPGSSIRPDKPPCPTVRLTSHPNVVFLKHKRDCDSLPPVIPQSFPTFARVSAGRDICQGPESPRQPH